MGWGYCNRGRGFREAGPRGEDSQQTGGSDLQTGSPFPAHVSTSLDTPMSTILYRAGVCPPFPGPCYALSTGDDQEQPSGSCPTEVPPLDLGPDREGRQDTVESLLTEPHLGSE